MGIVIYNTEDFLGGKYTHKPYSKIKFSGGEIHVNVSNITYADNIIVARLYSSEDIMELALVINAMNKKCPEHKPYVFIPYLPYSRQDRVANIGDAFSLEVCLKLLTSVNAHFYTLDMHSDADGQFKHTLNNITTVPILKHLIEDLEIDFLVCPDKGAQKRFVNINFPTIYCEKVRDPSNGKLSGFKVNHKIPNIRGKQLLIWDDICDGGGTFLGLADLFPGADMSLFIAHGIYSKGKTILYPKFRYIYETDSFPQMLPAVEDLKCEVIFRKVLTGKYYV